MKNKDNYYSNYYCHNDEIKEDSMEIGNNSTIHKEKYSSEKRESKDSTNKFIIKIDNIQSYNYDGINNQENNDCMEDEELNTPSNYVKGKTLSINETIKSKDKGVLSFAISKTNNSESVLRHKNKDNFSASMNNKRNSVAYSNFLRNTFARPSAKHNTEKIQKNFLFRFSVLNTQESKRNEILTKESKEGVDTDDENECEKSQIENDLVMLKCFTSRLSLKKEDNKEFFKKIYISDKLKHRLNQLLGIEEKKDNENKTIKDIMTMKHLKDLIINMNIEEKLDYYRILFSNDIQFKELLSKYNIPEHLKDYILKIPQPSYNNFNVGFIKSIALNTLTGIHKAKNEDRICVILDVERPSNYKKNWPKIAYFALFDGHNGTEVSSFLKDNLYKYIFNQPTFPEYPYIAIQTAFKEAQKDIENKINQVVKENNNMISNLSTNTSINSLTINDRNSFAHSSNTSTNPILLCGSTVSVLLLIDDIAYTVNCGDSRIILSSNNMEEFYDLTTDHNVSNENEVSRVIKYGGKVVSEYSKSTLENIKKIVPGEMTVTRSLGDINIKTTHPRLVLSSPEISSFYINRKDDFILLGSDGIFTVLDTKEINLLCLASVIKKYEHLLETNQLESIKRRMSTINSDTSQNTVQNQFLKKDKTLRKLNKSFEVELLNGILRTSYLFGSTDNASGLLICLDNMKNIFFNKDINHYKEQFEYVSKLVSVSKLKSQDIFTFQAKSRVVFIKGKESTSNEDIGEEEETEVN